MRLGELTSALHVEQSAVVGSPREGLSTDAPTEEKYLSRICYVPEKTHTHTLTSEGKGQPLRGGGESSPCR